ncbi:hypothetical protein I552_0343 [Mycobacterium xenopi 3993]|nr:hypothetical protein I552_0343 [Mycobacterium xenopi 3993]
MCPGVPTRRTTQCRRRQPGQRGDHCHGQRCSPAQPAWSPGPGVAAHTNATVAASISPVGVNPASGTHTPAQKPPSA